MFFFFWFGEVRRFRSTAFLISSQFFPIKKNWLREKVGLLLSRTRSREELGLLQPSDTTADWRSHGGRAKEEVSRKSRACLSCFFGAGQTARPSDFFAAGDGEQTRRQKRRRSQEAEAVIESREAAEMGREQKRRVRRKWVEGIRVEKIWEWK